MKLFLVITVAGKVMISAGPLPYGMEECQSRVAHNVAELKEKWALHPEMKLMDVTSDEGIKAVAGECYYADQRRPLYKIPGQPSREVDMAK